MKAKNLHSSSPVKPSVTPRPLEMTAWMTLWFVRMTPLGSPLPSARSLYDWRKPTGGTTSVTDTSYSVLVELRLSLDTLDWSWVCSDTIFGSPFLQIVKDEQFNSDVVSPVPEDFALGLGKGVETDDDSKRWAGRYNFEDRGQVVRGRENDREGTVVGANLSILLESTWGDLHVFGNIWAQSLVKTDSDKTISLTSQINNLPFLPVSTPSTNPPTSPSTRFDPIARAIMWDTRMSDLRRTRTGDRGSPEPTFSLQSEESGSNSVSSDLESFVACSLKCWRVSDGVGVWDRDDLEHNSSMWVFCHRYMSLDKEHSFIR